MKIGNKGLALIPSEFLTLLISAVLIIFVFILWITNYFDVRTVVRDFQVDRHALDVSQALLSSDKLVYSGTPNQDQHFYRAVFDKEKLDSVFNKDLGLAPFLAPNNELDIAYPNSVMGIIVGDLETNEIWSTTVYGPVTYEKISSADWISCLSNEFSFVKKLDAKNIVEQFFKTPVGPWDIWSLQKCIPEFATVMSPVTKEKIENIWSSKLPLSTRGYPVAIKSGDEVHIGSMKVWLIEI